MSAENLENIETILASIIKTSDPTTLHQACWGQMTAQDIAYFTNIVTRLHFEAGGIKEMVRVIKTRK